MSKREYVGAFFHHWGAALICAALVSMVLGPALGMTFRAVLGTALGVKVVRARRHDAEIDRNADQMVTGPPGKLRLAEVTTDASTLDVSMGDRPVEAMAS